MLRVVNSCAFGVLKEPKSVQILERSLLSRLLDPYRASQLKTAPEYKKNVAYHDKMLMGIGQAGAAKNAFTKWIIKIFLFDRT